MRPDALSSAGNSCCPSSAAAVAAADRPVPENRYGLPLVRGSSGSLASFNSSISGDSSTTSDDQCDTGAAMSPAMFVQANISNCSGFAIGHRIEFNEPVIVVADAASGMRVFPVEEGGAAVDGKRAATPAAVQAVRKSMAKKGVLLQTDGVSGTQGSGSLFASFRPIHVMVGTVLIFVVTLVFALWATLKADVLPDPDPVGLKIIPRIKWRAKPPKRVAPQLQIPISRVVIQHTAGRECYDQDLCTFVVQWIQSFHMETRDDITYNFLVAGDGSVYEGRGWTSVWRQDNALHVALIGNFGARCPSGPQNAALTDFLGLFVDLGKVVADYKLIGGCQVNATASPGRCFMKQLRTWKHWSNYTSVPNACT